MRIYRIFPQFIICLVVACASTLPTQSPVQVLFVGNSLTYTGNLPAVFDALAASNMKSTGSEMIVSGGATLTQRVADGSVDRALSEKPYDYVVLQERGGDLICSFGPESCEQAEAAVLELAMLAYSFGAKPVSMGTYQASPLVSLELVLAERLATRDEFPYISVSDHFQVAINSYPSENWLYKDHGHPGHDLILLEAVLLYRTVFGELPKIKEFLVGAPMYTPNAHFLSPSPLSYIDPSQETLYGYTYTAESVAIVLAVIEKKH